MCVYICIICVCVSCSFSLSPFMYIDNSKMREFTFRLYFNRTSIYHNIIETLSVCFYQRTGATNTIWHIQSDLIGGASNRETNVKLQKQSSCQNWWFLSPSPVLSLHLFFRLCFYTIGIPHTREWTHICTWIQGIAASSQHHENMPMEDISNISPVQQREKDIYIVRKCEDRSIPRVQLP